MSRWGHRRCPELLPGRKEGLRLFEIGQRPCLHDFEGPSTAQGQHILQPVVHEIPAGSMHHPNRHAQGFVNASDIGAEEKSAQEAEGGMFGTGRPRRAPGVFEHFFIDVLVAPGLAQKEAYRATAGEQVEQTSAPEGAGEKGVQAGQRACAARRPIGRPRAAKPGGAHERQAAIGHGIFGSRTGQEFAAQRDRQGIHGLTRVTLRHGGLHPGKCIGHHPRRVDDGWPRRKAEAG